MNWLFNGLPIHALLVHFVVIVVPLAALCLVFSAVWPAAHRRLGIVTPMIALAALASVPVAAEAGEALEDQITETALSEKHAEMGENLLPWVIALFALAVVRWSWSRLSRAGGRFDTPAISLTVRRVISVALIVAAIAVAVGAVVMTVIIGESGATAVWNPKIG